jgi:hypothetical protein
MTLQHFIIIFGALQLLLSQLPNIHSLRGLNLLSTAATLMFALVSTGEPHFQKASSRDRSMLRLCPLVRAMRLASSSQAAGSRPLPN